MNDHTIVAAEMFRDGQLSLARAARMADMSLSEFATQVSRFGIPVINLTPADVDRDLETLNQWLADR